MIHMDEWNCVEFDRLFPILSERPYQAILQGGVDLIDDRSKAIRETLQSLDCNTNYFSFSRPDCEFLLNDRKYNISELKNLYSFASPLLLEANSLEFPELIYFFDLANERNLNFDVLYVEPGDYPEIEGAAGELLHRFELSEGASQVEMLPGFAAPTDRADVIVALGFEGHRFQAILQSEEYQNSAFKGIIGVPAFQPGWENRSYTENSNALRDALNSPRSSLRVAGANDPWSNYEQLDICYKGLSRDIRSPGSTLLLAPFGTKPVSIAFAWFVANNKSSQLGVIYDFVTRKRKQSYGIGRVHLWRFRSFNT